VGPHPRGVEQIASLAFKAGRRSHPAPTGCVCGWSFWPFIRPVSMDEPRHRSLDFHLPYRRLPNNRWPHRCSATPAGHFAQPPDRRLPGPRYFLELVKARTDDIWLVTPQCQADVLSVRWDTSDVADLIQSLEDRDFKSSEWCGTGVGMSIDCDAYSVDIDVRTLVRSSTGANVYVKFGFSLTSRPIVVVSCHP